MALASLAASASAAMALWSWTGSRASFLKCSKEGFCLELTQTILYENKDDGVFHDLLFVDVVAIYHLLASFVAASM